MALYSIKVVSGAKGAGYVVVQFKKSARNSSPIEKLGYFVSAGSTTYAVLNYDRLAFWTLAGTPIANFKLKRLLYYGATNQKVVRN